MNTLQVHRCQATTRLFLARFATLSMRIPRSQPFQLQRPFHGAGRSFQASRSTPSRSFCRHPQNPPQLSRCLQKTYSAATAVSPEPTIHPVFEQNTGTFQYLVADPATKNAAIVDPVLDYDKCSHTITTTTADGLLSLVREKGYNIVRILETHAHADHLTASFYLQRQLTKQQNSRPPVGIGKRIGQVQSLFGQRYGINAEEYECVFDKLFEDDEEFTIGALKAKALHLPGHTPDHLGYKIGENIFCGDSIFHTDIGTARCDFPGGSAHALYNSARKILSLPDHVKIWTGHDYPPGGERQPVPYVTVGEHRLKNKHLRDGVIEEDFVRMRRERDRHLAAPRLLHESLQVNVRAGRLPSQNEAGMRLLKVPIKVKGTETWN
ncbi:putative beta-lactamase hydrolase-like protein [Triangularia verruculosa]|uniref:Beta-lactamase hydrolase-like protein n=1 Tax=Triangularia verruculosa TaxID=2587418 RepID=A0AAN6X7N9_9PEZI|nr:putative beta-lactamase hydrolase-like protein [Triangularia verruculosa]